jgi:ankyrin repeat protein
MNLDTLWSEIGINAETSLSVKRYLLQEWFRNHISLDMALDGDDLEKIAQYEAFAHSYLEEIVPVVEGGGQLSYEDIINVVRIGLDQVLLYLKPDRALLDSIDSAGMSPLHIAALKGFVNTTKALLTLGATPLILNKDQQYPWFSALIFPVMHPHNFKVNKIELFKLLIPYGTQYLRHQDINGDTIFHQMAIHDLNDLIRELLTVDSGLAFLPNNLSQYPIHSALLNNRLESVKLLMEITDGDMLADNHGWVALHYAAQFSTDELLLSCCELSKDINVQDNEGRSALILAAAQNRPSTVKILIERGADINLTDANGFTALDHAVKSGNATVVALLVKNPSF